MDFFCVPMCGVACWVNCFRIKLLKAYSISLGFMRLTFKFISSTSTSIVFPVTRLTKNWNSPPIQSKTRIYHTSCVINRVHLDVTEEEVCYTLTTSGLPYVRIWTIISSATNNPSHLIRVLSAGASTTQHLLSHDLTLFRYQHKYEESDPPANWMLGNRDPILQL